MAAALLVLTGSAQALCLAPHALGVAPAPVSVPRAPRARLAPTMRLGGGDIEFDSVDSWDAQIAEQNAWFAQQQQQQQGGGWMGEQQAAAAGWMGDAPMGGAGGWDGGGWIDDRYMGGAGGAPPQVELVVPEGHYPGMQFPVDFGGATYYVPVPEGHGPGMPFVVEAPA
jgi:hypothetical protein